MTGKTIVVTGTAGDLGARCARALTEAGHHVHPGPHGAADQAAVDDAIDRVLGERGRIDVVVHAAGALCARRVGRAVLPHLRRQRDGLVVWVGSAGADPPAAGLGVDTAVVVPGPFTTGIFPRAGDDADPAEVAREVARLVGLPRGERPFRVYIDPTQDGAVDLFRVGDRLRRDLRRAARAPARGGR